MPTAEAQRVGLWRIQAMSVFPVKGRKSPKAAPQVGLEMI